MRVHHSVWKAVFDRDNGICQYCDADLLSSFSTYWSATVDHVLAVSAGGSDDIENLKLACTGCNCLLSRSGSLTSHEQRRAYVQKRIAEELAGYNDWRQHLSRDI